ncbi:MAG: hypothetical protein J6M44_01165 [Butyrivibrio sp.]|nr:hypothetical protein [Butyrivibrio sp.]
MGIKSITNALLYALKAFFSLLTWFFRALFKGLKFFFVFLPITSIIFAILFLVSIFVLVTGQNPLPQAIPLSQEPSGIILPLFESLKLWWISSVYSYKGQASYILLLILTVLMFIPVMTVFLCFSVLAGFGNILFFSVVADAVLYLLGALIGKSFVHQALSRYYRLFPDAGRKHEEKEYDRLLKKRNQMLEEEIRDNRRSRADDFYGDDDYEDDYYPEDEYKEDDYYPEDEYDDDDYPEDECAADYDEEYDEEYDDDYDDEEEYIEDFEDDYDDPKNHRRNDSANEPKPAGNIGTFDFFAGCNSRESVDKKYRSLVKLYHPDNMDGDTAALQEINVQYDKAKKRWS